MTHEERRAEGPQETPAEAPMEGDEGAPEIRRHAELGRAVVETRIRDVATSPPVFLPIDATVARAIETMRKKKVGAVLVVAKKRPRKLVGILTERDLLQRVLVKKGYGRLALQKVMTAAPETLRPGDSLAYALNKMSVGRFRHVPLVDEDGVPVGMLSVRDVIDFVVELIPEQVLNLPPEPDLEIHRSPEGE
jgi:CBS domain-containing protein